MRAAGSTPVLVDDSACDQVDTYFDCQLPAPEADAFQGHLTSCSRCLARLDELLQLDVLMARHWARGFSGEGALRALADLLPYAESRAEDIQEDAENPEATDADRELAAKAWAAVKGARKLLGLDDESQPNKLSTSPAGGAGGAPPPADAPPRVGAAEFSRQAGEGQEPAAAKEGAPPPASDSWRCDRCGASGPSLTTSPTLARHMEICPARAVTCDEATRWLNQGLPSGVPGEQQLRDHVLDCSPCADAAASRALCDAARLG
jgi:hypothetical protein